MKITRKLSAALAGGAISVASLTGIAIAAGPAATAASVPHVTSTTCKTANATATITPGLRLTAKSNKIKATFKASNCTKESGATSDSGTISLTSKTLTCISGSATGTFTAKNNKNATSSGTMTLKATSTPFKFTLTGKVSKGFLKGSSISGTFQATPKTGNCTGSAMTKATIANKGNFKL